MWSIILFSPTYPIEDNYCFLAFFAQQILVKKKKKSKHLSILTWTEALWTASFVLVNFANNIPIAPSLRHQDCVHTSDDLVKDNLILKNLIEKTNW